jgi:predicted ATP-grasp superfamily ATP-dependent carboligase
MPIYVLETTRQCAAAWSRHCRFVRTPSLEGDALVATLSQLATDLGCRPVLILTDDQSVNTVSEHRETLGRAYRISLPRTEIVRALADKTSFQALAETEGFAVPRAVAIWNADSLGALSTLTPPFILKPADKTLVLKGQVERAVRANTRAEATAAALRMLSLAPRIIVQEWIDGPDESILFTLFSCDREGKLLGVLAGRKLVCSPPAIGSTALCIAAPDAAAELVPQTLEFIARVGYRGLGSLEFKRDSKSGRCFIIEPTVGRTDWQEEIATLCGVNLPLLTYWAELDRPAQGNGGALRQVAWRSSLAIRAPRALVSQRTPLVDGYFRYSDLAPAAYYYLYECALLRLWQRASRTFREIIDSE